MSRQDLPKRIEDCGAIVIGRNEGERLIRSIKSLLPQVRWIVYVDSNSNDDSIGVAAELGAHTVALDLSMPFTAARARNAGVERLRQLSEVRYVQFVDGDCTIDPSWISTAVDYLDTHEEVGALSGRLREKGCRHSVLRALCDLEWDVPVGDDNHCGGIFIMPLKVFDEAGGFDSELAVGEEPDLCRRIREQGLVIRRVAESMGEHDSGMTHFAQWWVRSVRGGSGTINLAFRPKNKGGPLYRRQVFSVWMWTVAWLFLLIAALIISFLRPSIWSVGLCAVIATTVPAQMARLAIKSRNRAAWRVAVADGVMTILGKWAQLEGHIRWVLTLKKSRKPAAS
jgi:GT2 family glycosyltransferase